MAVEEVVCPRCGSQAIATVPDGHRLSEVTKSDTRWSNNYNMQDCACKHCKGVFYARTYAPKQT